MAMISQSGNVAVNALGSRRGIRYHTVLSTGNQAVLDASDWLAADLRARRACGSVAMFLEEDGDGERLAAALARLRRARRPGGRAQGRRLRGRRAGGLGPHRRGRRRPAGVPRPGRGGRRAPGRTTPTSCWSSPASWPSRGPGRAATAGSRSSPARAATRASPPTRPRASAPSCPSWPPGPASDWRELLPDAATVGNPLDYTAMIWGDTDLLAADHGDGRRRPGDRPAAGPLRPPAGPGARRRRPPGPRSAPGSSPAPTRPRPPPWSPRPSPT